MGFRPGARDWDFVASLLGLGYWVNRLTLHPEP